MKINQSAFIQDLGIKERLTNYNTNVISMKAGSFIKIIDLEDYKEVDLYIYQWLIGKLIHLVYDISPDIAFVIRQLSKYNADLRKGHLQVAKKLVRYLKSTIDMSLIFGQKIVNYLLKEPPLYGLVGYVESNFARDLED